MRKNLLKNFGLICGLMNLFIGVQGNAQSSQQDSLSLEYAQLADFDPTTTVLQQNVSTTHAVGSFTSPNGAVAEGTLSVTYTDVTGPVYTCELVTAAYVFSGLTPSVAYEITGQYAGQTYVQSIPVNFQGKAIFMLQLTTSAQLVFTNIKNLQTNESLAINEVFDIVVTAPKIWYLDADGDGYGNPDSPSAVLCLAPEGYVALAGDCDDNNAQVNPGMPEIPFNGIDDNCDGDIDTGVVPTTQLLDAICGFTLNQISSPVKAYKVDRATGYRFKVVNITTGETQFIDRTDREFYFANLTNGGSYSSTYIVSVELQLDGVWTGTYGPECFVSTPALFADDQGSLLICGLQLSSYSEVIRTTARAGVRTYRFKVSHYNELGEYEEELMDRPLPWFNFTMLSTAKYGTSYNIEVAVKTENGPFSDFGTPCEIISPSVPVLIDCGKQLSTSSDIIYAESKIGIRGYKFEFLNLETYETIIITSPQHWTRFFNVPGFTPGVEYSVRVAVMTKGNWSPYGESCNIFAPMAAARTAHIVKAFDAVAYPTVYTEDFRLGITMTNQEKVEVAIYDMLGRLMDNRVLEAADAEYAVFGKNLPAGIYNVIVTQGAESKVVRVVKQ